MIAHAIKRWLQALYVLVREKKNLNYFACVRVHVCYAAAQSSVFIPSYTDRLLNSSLEITAGSLNLVK